MLFLFVDNKVSQKSFRETRFYEKSAKILAGSSAKLILIEPRLISIYS